ncbi:glycosyltransferase family 4 protein [Streptomyces sp. SCSIO 30461]|uniref:glycosyltransferase family 4 protein n=1 Tax=Streptomyces sp. SCSIO 30461 TaxID=3118085 RepID=UPI0030D3D7D3
MNSQVLYLALGSYRVRAAVEHVRQLASSGSRVDLVVIDAPEWSAADGLAELDGVEILKLRADKHGSAWGAAKKLLADRSGPFTRAGLLIAGDAQALPVAWAAQRRRPDLELRLESYDTAGRAAAAADVAMVTPWYPSPNNPYAGSFVAASASAVSGRVGRIQVIHTEDWSGRADPALNDAIKVTVNRLQERRELVPVLDTPEGELLRVPVPLINRKNYAPWVTAQETALRKALPKGRIEAPVVHAHTGIYGGVLATRLAASDARVVVTEHSSFLAKVFEQAAARRLYAEVLERADVFLCVSEKLLGQIAQEFPEHAHKLRVVPNVVGFERFSAGPRRDPRMLRWLYVGRLTKPKGVHLVLESFAQVAQREPDATLTMVGHGGLEQELTERAAELGVADRFRLLPPVDPAEVNELMHQHDLLVHASKGETFGMTVVEAVASGLPVLVTRSGGPEESLAGIESAAGALMDVSDDPRVITDAYWRLREEADALDLAGARKVLEERYGADAVAEQLIAAYEGRDLPAPQADAESTAVATGSAEPVKSVEPQQSVAPDDSAGSPGAAHRTEPVGRAIVLALTPAKPRRIVDFANHLVEQGVEVTLVTARATAQWKRLDLSPEIPVLSIETAEKKLLIPRGERFLVYRAPRAVLRRARRLAAKKRDAIGPELAVAKVQRVHTRYANAFHKKVFNRGYMEVRPRVLAKLTRRHAQPELDLAHIDHVFVSDINSTVTGWKWAKAHPHLKVTTHLDRDTYAVD